MLRNRLINRCARLSPGVHQSSLLHFVITHTHTHTQTQRKAFTYTFIKLISSVHLPALRNLILTEVCLEDRPGRPF